MQSGWLYHLDFGWIYLSPNETGEDLWFWKKGGGGPGLQSNYGPRLIIEVLSISTKIRVGCTLNLHPLTSSREFIPTNKASGIVILWECWSDNVF